MFVTKACFCMHRAWLKFIYLMLLCVLAGCATPPNIEPFADATAALRNAVVEGGAATASAMSRASDASGNNISDQFTSIWQERIKLINVLTLYSDSLSGIVSASNDAGNTSEALGSSIMELATYVPVGGAAISNGVNLGQLLLKTGLEIKANHDLGQAIDAVHPTMEKVAVYLQADLEELKVLYKNATLTMKHELSKAYGQRENHRNKLLAKRQELRSMMLASFNDRNVERDKKLEDLIALTDAEHQEYLGKKSSLMRHQESAIQLFDKAKQGIGFWLTAHKELKLAIEQNRRPNVRLIVSAAEDIRNAVNRINQ